MTEKPAMGKAVTSPGQSTCVPCNSPLTDQLEQRLALHAKNPPSSLLKGPGRLCPGLPSPFCVDDGPMHADYFFRINAVCACVLFESGSSSVNLGPLPLLSGWCQPITSWTESAIKSWLESSQNSVVPGSQPSSLTCSWTQPGSVVFPRNLYQLCSICSVPFHSRGSPSASP